MSDSGWLACPSKGECCSRIATRSIRNLEAEEDTLSPRLDRMKKSFDEANDKVAKFKAERDQFQTSAGTLIPDVKRIGKTE